MLLISEIKKQAQGLSFDNVLDVKETLLKRNSEILDIENVRAVGSVSYDKGLYILDYQLTYTITLASSRSLEPVALEENQFISELFMEADWVQDTSELGEEEFIILIEDDRIHLEESVIDNILLSIPIRVLTKDEEKSDQLPSGNDWNVMTETQYEQMKKEKQVENNPFSSLDGLFDE